MRELFGSPYNAEAAEAGVEAMCKVMGRLAIHPPNDDRYVAANCVGMLDLNERNPEFGGLLRLFANSRRVVPRISRGQPGMGAPEAVGILRAVYQDSMLAYNAGLPDAERYPLGRNDPARCKRDIEEILADPERHAYFMTNLLRKDRRVQTNRSSRYATVEILGQLLGKSSILDVGCGIMQGPEQLYHKEQYPFAPISMHAGNTKNSPLDGAVHVKANALLARSRAFHRLLATDITSPYDIGTHTWSKASLRPTEMLNDNFMNRVDTFAQATLSDRNNPNPRIQFFEGDFTSEEEMAPLMKAVATDDENKLDAVALITFNHQIGDIEQFDPNSATSDTIVGRARRLLKPDGVLIAQDFMYGPYLTPYADWRPGHYRTFVLQMDNPKQQWEEVFVALDVSQCIDMRLGKGTLYIDGEHVPIREAMLSAL